MKKMTKKRVVSLILAFALVLSQFGLVSWTEKVKAETTSTNLLTNGGFEDGSLNGWGVWKADDAESASVETWAAETGNYGLAMVGNTNGGFISIWQNVSNLSAGSYTFSFDLMGSGSTGFNETLGTTGTTWREYKGTRGTWQHFSYTVDLKAQDSYCLGLKAYVRSGSDSFCIDNLTFVKNETTEGTTTEGTTTEETTTEETTTTNPVYTISLNQETVSDYIGDSVDIEATVLKDGTAVTDLSSEGLQLWIWTDTWNDHSDGLSDATYSNYDKTSGYDTTATVKTPSAGTYYICSELKRGDTSLAKAYTTITVEENPFAESGYSVVVSPETASVEAGDSVTMNVRIGLNGEEITDSFSDDDLNLYVWVDTWATGHTDGLKDCTISLSGTTATVTTPSVGTYYICAQLTDSSWNEKARNYTTITVSAVSAAVEDHVNVTKVANLSDDFIKGVDISSVYSELQSGVVYYDYDGNKLTNLTDFCKFLKSQGITHIRVRVWNNPYDSEGNGYGGGNNDVATAKLYADAARSAGLKMLVDFHCSDFWTDPSKYQAPKAWASYTVAEKATALQTFMTESLNTIDPTKDVVTMVQVGNETTGGFVGETNTANMCTLFSAGIAGVKAYNSAVKTVIHVTNPESSRLTQWAKNLSDNNVDYDILATSYYPYWHGTFENLISQMETVKEKYGKDVMVAETSYAYTLDDSDGHDNTVRSGKNDSGFAEIQSFSVQGQVNAIRNVINAVNEAGGLGVFYWEPAWITVGDTTGLTGDEYTAQVNSNKTKWEQYGSGWAASYAGSYDAKDAGVWYGGSAVDNEAMFYADGTPTLGWKVWNYVNTGAVSSDISVDAIADASTSVDLNGTLSLPSTVTVTYSSGDVDEAVTWDVSAVDTTKAGTYTATGNVTLSKTVNTGDYAGKTEATITAKIIVKPANLLDADLASLENGTSSDYEVSSTDIQSNYTKGDSKDGTTAIHWWKATASDETVTLKNALELEAGDYALEVVSQGYAGDLVSLNILDEDGNTIATGDQVTLNGWAEWKTAKVTFTITETTKIKYQFAVSMQAGGWGTADCFYLYKTESTASETDEDSTTVDTKNETTESTTGNTEDTASGAQAGSSVDVVVTPNNTQIATPATVTKAKKNNANGNNVTVEEEKTPEATATETVEKTEAPKEEVKNADEEKIVDDAAPLADVQVVNTSMRMVTIILLCVLAALVVSGFGLLTYKKMKK